MLPVDEGTAAAWHQTRTLRKKNAYLGWRTGLFTAMLYIRIQVLSGMSSTSENKQLIQLPCIPL